MTLFLCANHAHSVFILPSTLPIDSFFGHTRATLTVTHEYLRDNLYASGCLVCTSRPGSRSLQRPLSIDTLPLQPLFQQKVRLVLRLGILPQPEPIPQFKPTKSLPTLSKKSTRKRTKKMTMRRTERCKQRKFILDLSNEYSVDM